MSSQAPGIRARFFRGALIVVGVAAPALITTLAYELAAGIGARSNAVPADGTEPPRTVTATPLFTPLPATGAARAAFVASAAEERTAAPEGTPLLLFGTLAFDDPAAGLAIVGESVQTATLYATNEEVRPGMSIRAIYADHVILERAGIRRVLTIAWARPGFILQQNTAAISPASAPTPSGNALSGQLASDGPVPGIQVVAGRNRVRFARLGLRSGDIVTAVNGVAISDASDIERALAGAQSGTLTVFRAGRTQQITLGPQASSGP